MRELIHRPQEVPVEQVKRNIEETDVTIPGMNKMIEGPSILGKMSTGSEAPKMSDFIEDKIQPMTDSSSTLYKMSDGIEKRESEKNKEADRENETVLNEKYIPGTAPTSLVIAEKTNSKCY
jgi:hypothetical protein